jgi:hypothetical protein
MPSLFNPAQRNAFGFPVGNNGEVDETKATVQPQDKPFFLNPVGFKDDFISRFQGALGSNAGFSPILKYLSGQGGLSVSQPIFKGKDEIGKEQLTISPGGGFNLQRIDEDGQPNGFSVTGDPLTKTLGFDVPVGSGKVGLVGSWNNINPYVKAEFAFGGKKQPIGSSPEQAVTAALGPDQQTETRPKLSAREQADQLIEAYRNSGGRDPYSPTTWQQ